MKLIKILYKLVENPHSSQNYYELREYFDQNNMQQIADAFAHLIKVKYGTDNSNTPEQKQQS